MSDHLSIDGSHGEGGGQIVRTAVALAAVTGKSVEVRSIRAGRRKPGLRRQHLTAVKAAAEITRGFVDGADLGSTALRFRPGRPVAGDYQFDVGTAGSATLIIHTILWPLLRADGRSRVVVRGGTHNPLAPPYEHLERCFLPVLREMGALVEVQLEQHGFFPAGGGSIVLEVKGPCQLRPVEILEAGPLLSREATAVVANLPGSIAVRELKVVREQLGWDDSECHPHSLGDARGPGNVLLMSLRHQRITEVITGFGQKGVRAERVARQAVAEVDRYVRSGAPVGEHLADQLIVPMMLGGGGRIRTLPLSSHAHTSLQVVNRFAPLTCRETRLGDSVVLEMTAA